MRLGFIIWCVLGLSLIGLKAHVDRAQLKYSDVAVKAGTATYLIPRAFVEGGGWRADMMRVAGCWDAREAGVLPVTASAAGCGAERSLRLRIPARVLGAEVEAALRGKILDAMFWTSYLPPAGHMTQLAHAWAGHGEWAGRLVVPREDWGLVRLQSPRSPWVPLLTAEPQTGDPNELAALYAGRCYRPDALSDIGMTCAVAVRTAQGAVLEYELGPDEVGSFALLRQAMTALTAAWLSPQRTAAIG
ncbi:MAG: hypothetical protein HOP13_11945 [Alphaproteobacteria bacterium]|nr:hypothetical protein [Alphaproteobacteria bacterium]